MMLSKAVILEKTLESPLDSKEIKPVNPKGNQSWNSLEGLMLKLKLILWPPDVKSQLTVKDPDAGEDWGQEEKGATEDEMVGWHHRLNGHESEQTQIVKVREVWHAVVLGVAKSQTWLSLWTTTIIKNSQNRKNEVVEYKQMLFKLLKMRWESNKTFKYCFT